jgi:DNA/RNA endonuclease G (NUC1)
MTNMLPQIHPFNAGDWKTIETQERVWAQTATLHILAGDTGSLGKLPAGENIPAFMWKAIYMDGKWTCRIMANQSTSKGHPVAFWEKPLADFNLPTGLHLR